MPTDKVSEEEAQILLPMVFSLGATSLAHQMRRQKWCDSTAWTLTNANSLIETDQAVGNSTFCDRRQPDSGVRRTATFAFSFLFGQTNLSQPNDRWRDFDVLVVFDVLQGGFE